MDFILSRQPCFNFNTSSKLVPNVWYEITGQKGANLFVFDTNSVIMLDTCNKPNSAVIDFKHKGNNYYIISAPCHNKTSFASVKYQGRDVQISLCNQLNICIDGKFVLNKNVQGIEYKQFEIVKNHLIIYFEGVRNFFVIIKNEELMVADFYDELNISADEVYFLKRLKDSINHGKVFCVNNKGYDSYLVYLDEYDLNLKPELMPAVMLDLVRAKNFKYAINLLEESLRPKQAEKIGSFFEEFDDFFALSGTEFCLIKNDTFIGIVKFEINNGLICNISFN